MAQKRTERRVNREYRQIYDQLSAPEIAAFERVKEKKRRARQKKRRLKIASIFVVLLLLAYIISPISKVQALNIYQNKVIDTNSIRQQADIQEGKTLSFFVNKFFLGQKLRQNPFVNGVQIEKQFGGIINITVNERQVIYKTQIGDVWIAYFSDGTSAPIPAEYIVNATVLIPVATPETFPYAELAQNLAHVPRDIVEQISEIKHNPSNLDEMRFMFYMKDRNRVSILMENIKTKMKYYFKLVEKSNGERFEYIMEYSRSGVIGRRI